MMKFEDEVASANDRYLLQDRYIELTRVLLPAEARLHNWRLRDDHCFMRVILDQLFQDCWYGHLDRRLTAYKQLNVGQLQQGIALAEKILREGELTLIELNRQSLRWRREAVMKP